MPAEDVLKPMIENLSTLNQALGEGQKQEQDTDRLIRSLSHQLAGAERKLEKLYHTQQLGEAHSQRQKRVEDVPVSPFHIYN